MKILIIEDDLKIINFLKKGLETWGLKLRYKANAEITIVKLISKSVE